MHPFRFWTVMAPSGTRKHAVVVIDAERVLLAEVTLCGRSALDYEMRTGWPGGIGTCQTCWGQIAGGGMPFKEHKTKLKLVA